MQATNNTSPSLSQAEAGPRIVILKRSPDYGYGFTLRHFIVYPPEPSEVASKIEGALFSQRHQPLDTIFIKQVRPASPAYHAHLKTGDRIIDVNNRSVCDHTYQDIVAVIQRSSTSLRLVVVPKQHDILQQIFSNTAHNPESNLNLNLRCSVPFSSILSSYKPPDPEFTDSSHSLGIPLPPVKTSEACTKTTFSTMPSLPAHRISQTRTNHAHYTSFVQSAAHQTGKKSRKQSVPMIVDRKQAVYGLHQPSGTPSPHSSLRKRDQSTKNENVYEAVTVKSQIQAEPKRLERDPNGRLYEVRTPPRLLHNNVDNVPKNDVAQKSFLSSFVHPSKHTKLLQSTDAPSLVSSKSPYSCDKSTQRAIERIQRNIERKEQFLIGGSTDSFPPKGAMVYRQYQVSPQRLLPRPTWPPTTTQSSESLDKPHDSNQALRRVKSNIDGTSYAVRPGENRSNSLPSSPVANDDETTHFFPPGSPYAHIKPLVGNAVAKPYGSHLLDDGYGKKPFVSKLSRIQENIASCAQSKGTCASTTSLPTSTLTQSDTSFGSNTSLTPSVNRMVPLAWVGDNERVKQLQIVSTRAKKFESMKDSDFPLCKSALQRFELSRLSHKSKPVSKLTEDFENNQDDTSSLNGRLELGTYFNEKPLVSKQLNFGLMKSPSEGSGRLLPVSRDHLSLRSDCELEQLGNGSDAVSRGTRANPVGGPNIHCEPPSHYIESPVKELASRDKATPQQSVDRECDKTQAVEGPGLCWQEVSPVAPRRPNFLNLKRPARPYGITDIPPCMSYEGAVGSLRSSTGTINEVCSQQGSLLSPDKPPKQKKDKRSLGEHERLVRRVSYLKATSEKNLSDTDHESDDDKTVIGRAAPDLPSPASFKQSIVLHGQLNVKISKQQRKQKSGHRSWKLFWAVIRGRALLFYKDKQVALLTPLAPDDQVTLRGSDVAIANDYTKKRNVLRLTTPVGSQFLLQAESEAAMTAWLTSLTSATAQATNECRVTNTPTPTSSAPDLSGPVDAIASDTAHDVIHSDGEVVNKNMKKVLSPRRTRSPSNQWPIAKARKSTGETDASPKSKTWKGRIGKHLKKMQVSSALSPSSSLPHGASIGVCIDDCPPSIENEMVPLIVALCVGVIESKGSNVQGIYRVPGNRAAVTYLTEMVNQGPDAIDLFDPRWSDINVIASLLKQFFQKLPEPLIPSHLYTNFIEASRIENPQQRLVELKELVHELPPCHHETLHFLMNHFTNIVSNSQANKMDVKNLAIVFGPTLIRASDDNVARLVTDMSHQCRIVESLITYRSWFFNDSQTPPPDVGDVCSSMGDQPTVTDMETSSQSLLLNNVNKVEGTYKDTNKFVSTLISAANRIHKNRAKKPDDFSPDGELADPVPMNRRRISTVSASDGQCLPSEIVLPSKEDKYLGDEVAIRSYTGLSARTQERIRQFELETRAMMLQRDILSRQESQKLEWNRKKVEDELQKAKKDLETEDIFDRMAKNPSEVARIGEDVCESDPWKREGDFRNYHAASNVNASNITHHSPTNTTKKGATGRDISRSKSARETILRHILPFHHSHPSPRPIRRGSSAESLAPQPNTQLDYPASDLVDRQFVVSQAADHHPSNEGSDLLRDITATFEEKMKSLQESPFLSTTEPSLAPPLAPIQYARRKDMPASTPTCKLYRDPSLHRRRSKNVGDVQAFPFSNQAYPAEDWQDAFDLAKCDKRSRHGARVEKRAKQSIRSKTQEVKLTVEDLERIDSLMNSSPLPKYNLNELKEKFETTKCGRAGTKGRKSKIKRRHTVGGMKDLARVAWMRVIEAANQQKSAVPTSDQIQLFIESVNENRIVNKEQAFVAREKLAASDVEALFSVLQRASRDGHKPLQLIQ